MAESGRVAGSAPADPDPESGQTRPESGRVGLSRDSELCKPVPWVGRCPPQSWVARGRPDSESADSAPSRPTLPSMIGGSSLTLVRLPFWSYAKLILNCWLVLPYFSGAAYVYQHYVRTLFVNNQTVNIWYVPRKKDMFSRPDDVLVAAEKFIAENGPEALEKLMNKRLSSVLDKPEELVKIISSLERHPNSGAAAAAAAIIRQQLTKQHPNPGAVIPRYLTKQHPNPGAAATPAFSRRHPNSGAVVTPAYSTRKASPTSTPVAAASTQYLVATIIDIEPCHNATNCRLLAPVLCCCDERECVIVLRKNRPGEMPNVSIVWGVEILSWRYS
ncbi:hypothetical protein Taro_044613 [Colocasia esculenta]|uniref:HVA22-like protein n=1 Tax=Colocasia esculenta TaxID=4460 RepID=A0A843WJN7_COLES|nr:hypothetical protein [Colocasia esculenta]